MTIEKAPYHFSKDTDKRTMLEKIAVTSHNSSVKSGKGFLLMEMLVYIALLAGFSLLVVAVILSLGKNYNEMRAAQHLTGDAMLIIDRLGYEIRRAESVDTGDSTLDSSPGRLSLVAEDDDEETTITLESGTVRIAQDGVETGALNGEHTEVISLVFRQVGSGASSGIRTEFALLSSDGAATSTENFYTFFVMREAQ